MEKLVDGNCNCERRKMDDDGKSVWDNVCTCRWTAHGSRRRHFDHDHSELRQQFAVAKYYKKIMNYNDLKILFLKFTAATQCAAYGVAPL